MPIAAMPSRRAAVAVLAAVLALPLFSSALSAQDGIPDLKGTWSGTGWGVRFGALTHSAPAPEPTFKDETVVWTLKIDQQRGRGLIGTWSTPNVSEPLIGVIHADNTNVHFVDPDTYFDGTLRSENEMDICVQEATGDSMVATCYVLRRQ